MQSRGRQNKKAYLTIQIFNFVIGLRRSFFHFVSISFLFRFQFNLQQLEKIIVMMIYIIGSKSFYVPNALTLCWYKEKNVFTILFNGGVLEWHLLVPTYFTVKICDRSTVLKFWACPAFQEQQILRFYLCTL